MKRDRRTPNHVEPGAPIPARSDQSLTESSPNVWRRVRTLFPALSRHLVSSTSHAVASTSGSIHLVSVEARATSRSYIRWRFIQNSALIASA